MDCIPVYACAGASAHPHKVCVRMYSPVHMRVCVHMLGMGSYPASTVALLLGNLALFPALQTAHLPVFGLLTFLDHPPLAAALS